MSLSSPYLHQACYDSDGNIVILPDDVVHYGQNTCEELDQQPIHLMETVSLRDESSWNAVEDFTQPQQLNKQRELSPNEKIPLSVELVSNQTQFWLQKTLQESKDQYRAVAQDSSHAWASAIQTLTQIPSQVRTFLVRSSAIAATPVKLGKQKLHKPRSKATLFLIDTVRFGGTFAFIFVTLFVGINYQSFWQIAKADLALGNDVQTQHALANIADGHTPLSPLTNSLIDYQRFDDSLLAHLPPVGPPTNRIIIPSLGINAPVVEPKIDALVAQNWSQFEKDVQASLLQGVVHYPGSARPGQTGNVFLTGHSSFYPNVVSNYKDIFATLGNIRIGDTYSLYYKGDLHQYRVTEKKEVMPNNVSVLDQPLDKRISTLMTCTPVGTTLRRLIVRAEEIDPVTGQVLKIGERPNDEQVNPIQLEQLPI